MPQQPIDSLLEWGCGAGTLALLLACLTGRATGTDFNPRAIHLARWNVAVNGIANLEFRCGDGFASVAREQFECIVSQPPYHPCPAGNTGSHVFLHGGPRGDEIARLLIDALPAHRSGSQSRAFVLASWPNHALVPQPHSLRLLELYTAVGDVPGTRRSLAIPSGNRPRPHRGPRRSLGPRLPRTHRATPRSPSSRMLGTAPVTEAEWRCLTGRNALAYGWLTISSSANRANPSGGSA